MNNENYDILISTWDRHTGRGLGSCPCGFASGGRYIKQHRETCHIWIYMIERHGRQNSHSAKTPHIIKGY